MMHGRIQKILSGGLGVLKTLFCFFHRGQCGPGLLFKAFGPKGSYFFSLVSIFVFFIKSTILDITLSNCIHELYYRNFTCTDIQIALRRD